MSKIQSREELYNDVFRIISKIPADDIKFYEKIIKDRIEKFSRPQ